MRKTIVERVWDIAPILLQKFGDGRWQTQNTTITIAMCRIVGLYCIILQRQNDIIPLGCFSEVAFDDADAFVKVNVLTERKRTKGCIS